jgi:hypothetical protein
VNFTFGGVALPRPEGEEPTVAYRFEHGLLEGPVIDDDALRDLLDRAVAPLQVREEILKAARAGRHAVNSGAAPDAPSLAPADLHVAAGPFRMVATARCPCR